MPPETGPAGTRDPLRAIYEREHRRPRRSRLLAAAAAVFVIGAFAVIVAYAYHVGKRTGVVGAPPLIKAEQQPYKVKPEEPGGMAVPHQDKLIYNEVSPKAQPGTAKPAEKLMPPPEAPMPRPAPPAPAPAAPAEVAPGGQQPGAGDQPVAQPPKEAAAAATETAPAAAAQPAPAPSAQSAATSTTSEQAGQATEKPPAAPGQESANEPTAAAKGKTPPQVASKGGPGEWRIQLGAVRSPEEAQREWARLKGTHAELLQPLSLSVVRAELGEGKGTYYRIQGGPLPDRDAASSLCERLKSARVGCLVVKPQ
jgi:hypothetical protein